MSLRTDMLPVAEAARAISGPTELDARTVQVTVRTRTWLGGRRGVPDGNNFNDVDLVLPQRYRVRLMKQEEISSSGGRFRAGDVRVGGITPKHATGGFSPEDLKPVLVPGQETIYLLTGAISGEYKLVNLQTDHIVSYFLVLRNTRVTPE